MAVSLPVAATSGSATSADEKLRALYTAEWEWRQKEVAREPGGESRGPTADHLPRVDAQTQQKRLAYWTKVLAQLDEIPLSELSPEEKVNAQVFRTIIQGFVNDIRFKL